MWGEPSKEPPIRRATSIAPSDLCSDADSGADSDTDFDGGDFSLLPGDLGIVGVS